MPTGTPLAGKTDQAPPDGLLSWTVEILLHIPADIQQQKEDLKFSIPVLKKQNPSFFFAKQENPDLYKKFYSRHLQCVYHTQKATLPISSLKQNLRKNKGVLEKHPLRSLALHDFPSLWPTSFIPTNISPDKEVSVDKN